MVDRAKWKFCYLHKPGCGEPAFLASRQAEQGDFLNPAEACHLDGRVMQRGERIVCDTCGEGIFPMQPWNVVPHIPGMAKLEQ